MDHKSKQLKVLLDNGALPSIDISKNIDECLTDLLKRICDISREWVVFSLSGVYNIEDGMVQVIYSTLFPEAIPVKIGSWTTLMPILQGDFNDKEIVAMAVSKIYN